MKWFPYATEISAAAETSASAAVTAGSGKLPAWFHRAVTQKNGTKLKHEDTYQYSTKPDFDKGILICGLEGPTVDVDTRILWLTISETRDEKPLNILRFYGALAASRILSVVDLALIGSRGGWIGTESGPDRKRAIRRKYIEGHL